MPPPVPPPVPARDATKDPAADVRLYDEDAGRLLSSDTFADRVTLLPGAGGKLTPGARLRVLWGQDMLRDLLDGRYRTVICGVNDEDNSHGIIAQLCELIPASQWSARSVTSYAQMFHQAVDVHAAHDREPYVLKFDLDSLLIFALLRPRGRKHFTLDDLGRGFVTCAKMLRDRRERHPVATVSFLNARVNRLLGPDGREPSFESVLKTLYHAGFRGDVYPSPAMWRHGHTGVFPSYPFPEGFETARGGSS
ncbi:MAG: hypothetical protein HRU70_05870 [Phycisphaeraceae bacterium]|nr:MAG: hypothetical protein HRU70_05870 [Phycisphaeraceae bacterium]